jgi:hypothetical protein
VTKQKLFEVIALYEKFLINRGARSIKIDESVHPTQAAALDHALAMLPEMRMFIREGRIEKVFRWLGFIQGILWSFGEFSLNELKDHSRPDGSPTP